MSRNLHIGGEVRRDGWQVLNVQPGPHVDFVGDCTDLSQFSEGSWDEVYISHVLEHLGYQEELPSTLREIHRILTPGGRLRASVPNLTLLCKMFLHEDLKLEEQFHIMRIMFGGQVDPFDFHKTGFNYAILEQYLIDAGFSKVERVKGELGVFDDTSAMRVYGNFLSLNVQAWR